MSSQSTVSPAQPVADLSRLPTPFVLIDQARVIQNIDRLVAYCAKHGISIRPHAKTHKSLQIGGLQLERGAAGLTVAKPSEAEVFAEICDDLLVAYPVVDPDRAARIACLANRGDVTVAVDSAQSVEVLSRAADGGSLGILIDLDVGLHRTGVQDPQAALELARLVDRSPNLQLRGLFCYPGHIWDPADRQAPAMEAVAQRLETTLELWNRRGLNAEIVSGGSTPTAYQSHLVPQLTEIRPGTYVFNDMNTVHGGYATLEDCAARIVATVVSDAVRGQVVIDAGSKTLAADRCISRPESGFGHVIDYPDARVTALSEEHGQVDVSQCSRPPQIGNRLSIIPNHICPCINLRDWVWMKDESEGVVTLAINARGRIL